VQADTRRRRARSCTSYSCSVLWTWVVIGAALPANVGRLYAQIMVKAGHLPML
jgi:hypothetical protein